MHCLGFGFDSVTDDFKVVRVVHTGVGYDTIPPEVESYTLKTGRWRYISDKALPLMIEEGYQQAYVNGAAHWIAFPWGPQGGQSRYTILSFNMSDEVFNEILAPESVTHEMSFFELIVFKASLSLIQLGDGNKQTFYTDTYAESLVLLNKLESPESAVVSGKKKKKNKKNKKKENEKKQKEAEVATGKMSRESIFHSCLGRLQVTKSTTSADRGSDTDAQTAGGGDGHWKMESLDLWKEQSIMQ
ncbi:hypothetical protein Vadar_001094 [Vaccinium darrowii]|uniref:Uncharacterized protein n=1 Tax=Vaccinium darrowii TaxID=229202 RepID=A0ACB7Z0S5_9ERIC|nr:hypothetical protein Vadar_001094 [Vaccinium darrowii]